MRSHLGLARLSHACCALVLVTTPASAQRLIVRGYHVIDGLPSERIVCAVTDRVGFLWICTSGGLARFDGSSFVTYGPEDGLPDVAINHFLQTRSGSRWVATNGGGVARLAPGTPEQSDRVFTAFDVGTTKRSKRVNYLFETKDGVLLAGTDGGLFRASDEDSARFELVPMAIPGYADATLQVWSIADDARGRVWVGTSAGLVLLHEDRILHIPINPVQGADNVLDVLPDREGRLWLAHDTGLFIWVPPSTSRVRQLASSPLSRRAVRCVSSNAGTESAVGLPEAPGSSCHFAVESTPQGAAAVRSLGRTLDGWIWMASRSGVLGFDGVRLRVFGTPNGLPSSALRVVAGDPGGELWVGTYDGLYHVQRRGFSQFTDQDGLIGSTLRSIFRGADGQLYAVAHSSVIHRLDGSRWTAVRPNLSSGAGLAGRSVYGAVLMDREGSWWIGTGEGLLRFPRVNKLEDLARTEPVRLTTEDGLAGNDIWRLYEDSRGDIWIATRVPGQEPLTRWQRSTGRFQRYGPAQGMPAAREVNAFAEDSSGTLWASLWDGGLVRFDGRRFHYVAPGPGDPAPQGHLFVDRRGWLWVTGRQLKFTRTPTARDPRFEVFRTATGQTLYTSALVDDRNGWMYAGTPGRLVRFDPEDARVQSLGVGGPFGGLTIAPYRDADGTLWFPSLGDLLHYSPRPDDYQAVSTVRIGRVLAAGAAIPVPPLGTTHPAPLSLAAGQRRLQIDYFGLGYWMEAPQYFQVRLEGVDDAWSQPTTQRSIVYAGLAPGRYRFQVRAVGASGKERADPATVEFTIAPPFWRRMPFILALTLLLAATLVYVHKRRLQHLLELERIRTRIAADLHDDLGASLARVSLLSEATRRALRDSPDRADSMLSEIGTTARALVTGAGDIAFAIDPTRDRLDDLVARIRRFAEDLLEGSGITWRFPVEGETAGVVISSDQRRHLLAIIKEALHNAVRHARPGQISVMLHVRDGILEVEIADDGCGFRATAPETEQQPVLGHGLRNVQYRARELGAHVDVTSRPGAGTRIALRLPLMRHHGIFIR